MLLDFGKQPVCHHFVGDLRELNGQYRHRLALGQCSACGVVQLVERYPVSAITPKHPWMVRYSEPEDHLDKLATTLLSLPGISKQAKICGVSFKDDTLLARLSARGCRQCVRLDARDLRIGKTVYGVETIQQHMTYGSAKRIVARRGRQDVVIARHILEHAFDPEEFFQVTRAMLSPQGYLVIEVPGIDQALGMFDYTTIWEEHTLYFTRETFRRIFSFFGFPLAYFTSIAYPLEDSLIAVARVGDRPQRYRFPATDAEKDRGEHFARAFRVQKTKLQSFLKSRRGKVALFGAGHLGCVWLNILELGRWVDLCIDDDRNKAGLRMPGSGIPIQTTSAFKGSLDLCLLGANPRNEEAIMEKNKPFFRQVHTVASIFPSSRRSIGPLL